MDVAVVAAQRRGMRLSREQRLVFWLGRLVIITGLLLLAGSAAVFTTTVFLRIALDREPYADFIQHLLFMAGGLVLAAITALVLRVFRPGRKWLRYIIPFGFFIALVLVAMVKFTPLGVTAMGATRGLDVKLFTFQPSEVLKIALVLYLGQLLCWWRRPSAGGGPADVARENGAGEDQWFASLARRETTYGAAYQREYYKGSSQQRMRLKRKGAPVWPELPKRCVVIILLAAGLTAIQPDLGSTSIMLASAFLILIVAGVHWRHMLAFIALLAILGLGAMLVMPEHYSYAAKRIDTWLHPMPSDDGASYQITQARGALAVGGVWGRGFLQSDQKMNRLPLSTKDFVFPVIVEELGYVGGVLVIMLFVYLAWVGIQLGACCEDRFARCVITVLALTISVQAMVNIGATIGTLPLTGLTLPFFSEGGTSLVVSLFAVGLMAGLALSELPSRAQYREDHTRDTRDNVIHINAT